MRIYKENIPPKQMMDSSTPFCRQSREGLLCWTYTDEGELFPSHPSTIWFSNTAWKEPAIISNMEEWLSVWEPYYNRCGFIERGMFRRLRQLDNDIDKLYWDDQFGKSGKIPSHLLPLLPRPIEEHLLMDIIHDLAKRYEINLDKDYWFNQRDTIHFWINEGLITFIGSLQYRIGLNKIEETNKIIREWIPSLKPYMDNRQFWQDFFKRTER